MPLVVATATPPASVSYVASGGTLTVKRGDTEPSLGFTFPAGVDLAGASVRFLMDYLAPKTAVVVSEEERTVRYDWAAADLSRAGVFRAEFEATLASGDVVTGPAEDWITVRVVQDLG